MMQQRKEKQKTEAASFASGEWPESRAHPCTAMHQQNNRSVLFVAGVKMYSGKIGRAHV